jgi:hypothetical protein
MLDPSLGWGPWLVRVSLSQAGPANHCPTPSWLSRHSLPAWPFAQPNPAQRYNAPQASGESQPAATVFETVLPAFPTCGRPRGTGRALGAPSP